MNKTRAGRRRILEDFAGLQDRFPRFDLKVGAKGGFRVAGSVSVQGEVNSEVVRAEYEIELRIPPDYPRSPPVLLEIGGKIDPTFHRMGADGSLCLTAPAEVRRVFAKCATLVGFVDALVLPYLLSHACNEQVGTMPFGEYSHGPMGLVEYYREYFGVETAQALRLLRWMADGSVNTKGWCPCGSGIPYAECHRDLVEDILSVSHRNSFRAELKQIVSEFRTQGLAIPAGISGMTRSDRRRRRRLAAEGEHR